MKLNLIAAIFAVTLALSCASADGGPSETRVPAGKASSFARSIGEGAPLIVLHGGPDFDHAYLLPDLDRLQDAYRLVYYDQRGRGSSADGSEPEDVTLESEMQDLDRVRRHFRFDAPMLLGHSWGTVLALEYAVRYPDRVSQLILLNPGPASASDYALLGKAYVAKIGAAMIRQREMLASPAYKSGDPQAVADRYRIHFTPAPRRAEDYETLMARMRAQFVHQGKD